MRPRSSSSSVREVLIRSPQGSILGPVFFIMIYLRSLVLVFCAHKKLSELKARMETATSKDIDSFTLNKLHCNEEKNHNILLNLSLNQVLQSVKLSCFYINLYKRKPRLSYLMWKLSDVVSDKYLQTAYLSILQSHISYELNLWEHSLSVSDILLIRKRY